MLLHQIGDRELHQHTDRHIDGEPQIDPEPWQTFAAQSTLASASSDSVVRSASLAPGMNAAGGRMPNCGCRQRANASTPTSCFRRRSIFGWYQNSIHPFASASLEFDARRPRRGVAELERLHDRDDRVGRRTAS